MVSTKIPKFGLLKKEESTDFIYNEEQTWDSGEGLVIQSRLYSSSSGSDPTKYFIDLISVS